MATRPGVLASRELMRSERRDIRSLLSQLTAEQWDMPSLCTDWSVRDLVVHLIGWDDLILYRTRREHAAALFRFSWHYGLSLASMRRLNRRLQGRVAERDRDGLLRFCAEDDADLKWLFDQSNLGAHLAEYVIHHQDIRRGLGLPRAVPGGRLVEALKGVTKLPGVRIGAWRQLRRNQMVATDVNWTRGRGAVYERSGEELLMQLAGRTRPQPRAQDSAAV